MNRIGWVITPLCLFVVARSALAQTEAPGLRIEPETFDLDLNDISAVAFSSNANRFFIAGVTRILMVETETRKIMGGFLLSGNEYFSQIAVPPGGSRLLAARAGLNSGSVLWDFETGGEILTFNSSLSYSIGLSVSPDGKRALVASYRPAGYFTGEIWDLESGELVAEVGEYTQGTVTKLNYSPDMTMIAVGTKQSHAYLWDAETIREIMELPHGINVEDVVFTADGLGLLTRTGDGRILLWDVITGDKIWEIENLEGLIFNRVFLAPDGQSFLALSIPSPDIRPHRLSVHDINTGEIRYIVSNFDIPRDDPEQVFSNYVAASALSPDGRRFIAATLSGNIFLWDLGGRLAASAVEDGRLH